MKTLLSVVILGLLMALCCSAAKIPEAGPQPFNSGASNCPLGSIPHLISSGGGNVLKIGGCGDLFSSGWWACAWCSGCYVPGDPSLVPAEYSGPDGADRCYMDCMAGFGYVDLKSGPRSLEIPIKQDDIGVLMDELGKQ